MRNALASAADEMAMALYRTAYSTIVRDCLDYSTSLCDAEGQMIAQGVTIPLHLGAVPFAMETLLAKYGDDVEEGDVFILNDPFEGGMHIPDIFIVQPVFWEGRCVAFAVSTAHHLDLGGRLPGSSACDNTEIFQEGLRIPWLKLYRRGEADEAPVRPDPRQCAGAADDHRRLAGPASGLPHRRPGHRRVDRPATAPTPLRAAPRI